MPRKPNTAPGASLAADAELQVSSDNSSNIYLMVGTEPSRKWKKFTHEIMDVLVSNNITSVVFLGAMLADVPHSRPISPILSIGTTPGPGIAVAPGLETRVHLGSIVGA